jgi:hypothetical protein
MVAHNGQDWIACSNPAVGAEPGDTANWTPWIVYDPKTGVINCS